MGPLIPLLEATLGVFRSSWLLHDLPERLVRLLLSPDQYFLMAYNLCKAQKWLIQLNIRSTVKAVYGLYFRLSLGNDLYPGDIV